jgi:hypothetical protein
MVETWEFPLRLCVLEWRRGGRRYDLVLVVSARVELTTFSLGRNCSIQLS